MMQPRLKIEKARVADLAPYAGNAKEHPEWQVEQIANSIREFGMCDPVGIWHDADGTPVIVEGHGRVLALKMLGIDECPTISLDHLDDDARRAYVHVSNQTNLSTGFDLDALKVDLADIPGFEWDDFGFDLEIPDDWFESRERNSSKTQEGNDEYNAFTEKFEPKKTTDDCYTPDMVYDAVADWVAEEYGLDRSTFVRPFFPGGDYENEEYPQGCVVVDNPPFSILAEILRFYVAHGVRFFLFAPTLTLFSGRGCDICYLPVGVGVTYENGASVNTSFITNMEDGLRIRTAPTLYGVLKEANDANQREAKGELPNYEYPPEVVTAAGLSRYSVHGVELRIGSGECQRISALDAMKASGKAIFGGGFLLGGGAAARNAEAARQKDENVRNAEMERLRNAVENTSVQVGDGGVVIWRLSDREREIAASLG